MPELNVTHLLLPLAEQGVQHRHAGRVFLQWCQREVQITRNRSCFPVAAKDDFRYQ